TVNGKNYYGTASSKITVKTNAASVTKPAQVTGVKLTNKTSSTATLSWNKASGAQKYYVFKYNSSTKKYTTLGSTTSTSYKITGLKANTTYIFVVQAVKTVNGKNYYGTASSKITVKTNAASTPPTITGLKITTDGKNACLKLSWNSQNAITGYQIYRSTTGKSGSYQKIATLKSSQLSYTDSGLKNATTYYYAVRTYKNTSNGYTYGSFAKANLSTKLTRDAIKTIIKKANKCYFDWYIGEALFKSLNRYDYVTDTYGREYYYVKSDSIKSLKDVELKLNQCFSKSYSESCIYDNDYSNYIEKNGKLYLAEPMLDYGPYEKLRFDSVNISDTKCTFEITTFISEYSLEETETYSIYYSNGKWIFNDNPVYSVSLFDGENPWLN
ncbi:MAG: fibronectin type III domain-containing protein, partial [Acutalibacteraceae bacterium]